MLIPAEEWLAAIKVRRSCRQYKERTIQQELMEHLYHFADTLNSNIDGARAVLVAEKPDEILIGIMGSYGKIQGAPAYVALLGDMNDPKVQEKLGYLGECFMLEATAKGLGACWVAGFFKSSIVAKHIKVKKNEKVIAVLPFGYPAKTGWDKKLISGLVQSHKRKSLSSLCSGLDESKWPEWARTALEAARLAPSALNRQPWRFQVEDDAIKVFIDSSFFSFGVSKALDCGISMLHIEVGAMQMGQSGSWEYLDSPSIARFKIKN